MSGEMQEEFEGYGKGWGSGDDDGYGWGDGTGDGWGSSSGRGWGSGNSDADVNCTGKG